MCFYNDDYAEFADSRAVVARKPHRCGECRGEIAPGESYEYTSGKSDGGFWTAKSCRRCCYDRNRIVEHELAEGCMWEESWPPHGEVVSYLKEQEMGQTRPEDVPVAFAIGDLPDPKLFRSRSHATA